jgi:hypothetical protein
MDKGNNLEPYELKKERRDCYGRERKVKDRRRSTCRCKKQGAALQHLRQQGRNCFVCFPHREKENETDVLRRLIYRVSCGNGQFLVAGDPLILLFLLACSPLFPAI